MYQFRPEIENLLKKMGADYHLKEKTFKQYQREVLKFIDDYMGSFDERRPIDAITYHEVDKYLDSLTYTKVEKRNKYIALRRFFNYTDSIKVTDVNTSCIKEPIVDKKVIKYINTENYEKLVQFLGNSQKPIKDRTILGLFIYTGLSRKYIFQLCAESFREIDNLYCCELWKDQDQKVIPIKSTLQELIQALILENGDSDAHSLHRLVGNMNENFLSTYISKLTKSITGERITPTTIGSTFIKNALSHGNNIWEVCELTLESPSTISHHITDQSRNLLVKQKEIIEQI